MNRLKDKRGPGGLTLFKWDRIGPTTRRYSDMVGNIREMAGDTKSFLNASESNGKITGSARSGESLRSMPRNNKTLQGESQESKGKK